MSDSLDPSLVDPILELFDQVQQLTGHSRYTIFTDWIGFMFTALQRNDPAHLDRVKKYQADFDGETTRDVMESYAAAFGELIIASESANDEVLGAVYERYGLTSKNFAQHFTPHSLAHAMAGMLIPDKSDIREATPDDPLRILDPASGSGRLLVATARHLSAIDPETPAVYTAIDIDRICAQMTAINYVLFGLPGWVIHGDALTLEVMNSWRILLDSAESSGVIRKCDLEPLPLPGAVQSEGAVKTGGEGIDQAPVDDAGPSVSEPLVTESLEEAADVSTNQVKLSDVVDRTTD